MKMQMFQSIVGRKIIMSLTGLSLIGFVALHLLGNSSVYYGPGGMNVYAGTLRSFGPFMWLFRFLVLVFVSLHVFYGILVSLENRKAKPDAYAVTKRLRSTFSGRNMIWTGLLTGSFIVYHLLHFTFHVTNPEISASRHLDAMGRPDVFMMVVLGFSNLAVAIIYILALFSLALHLTHGIQSMFQTLGLNTEKTEQLIIRTGIITAIILFLGYISIPVAVITGIVK